MAEDRVRRLILILAAICCLLSVNATSAELPRQDPYYSIQFAATPLAHKEKGLAIYEQIKAKGYFVYYFKIKVNGVDWMRLKAGLFPTVTQAKEFGALFKHQEGYDFYVANADVKVYSLDAEHLITATPNALWMTGSTDHRELLVFKHDAMASPDVLDRIETTLSPDKTLLTYHVGPQQYAVQLKSDQTPEEKTAPDKEAPAEDAESLYKQGFAFYKQEKLEQANAYFDKALAQNPQLVSAYYYRGIIHYRQEKYDLAIEDCTSAIKINPLHTEAYNIRALVWLEKGEVDRAIKDCDRVLKIDPQNIAAYSTLGVAWLQKGELDWACSDLRKACDLGRCETLETVKKQGYCQ